MSGPNDPAFPRPPVMGNTGMETAWPGDNGMTLREWYAGLALQGLCAHPGEPTTPKTTAEVATAMADALLAELKKGRS